MSEINLPKKFVFLDAVTEYLETLKAVPSIHIEFLILSFLANKFFQAIILLEFQEELAQTLRSEMISRHIQDFESPIIIEEPTEVSDSDIINLIIF